jgi:hypothetical protein
MAELAVARPLERRLAAHRSVAWVHGLEGGLASGVVMGLFMMVAMQITGYGFLRPLYLIGSLWYGSITTGATVAFVGAATLLVMAAVLGLVFAYIFSYVKIDPLVSGVAFGAIVWALMQYLVIPAAGSFILGVATVDPFVLFATALNPVAFPLWMVLAAFLVYGAALGAFEDIADRRRVRLGRSS